MTNKDMKSLQIKCIDEGKDLYTYIASVEFSTPYDEVTVDQRSAAKVMLLNYLYGDSEDESTALQFTFGW